VVRGRWARVGRLLVCRRTALVMSKYMPLVQPDRNSGACWVFWLRGGFREEERGSPVRSTEDQGPWPASEAAGPWGAREANCRCRLPRDSSGAGICLLRIQRESMPEKTGPTSLRLRTAIVRVGSRDCGAVKLLSTQIVCSTGESNFHLQRQCKLPARSSSTLSNSTNGCRAWQQRICGEECRY
jgi:hypothetical protein